MYTALSSFRRCLHLSFDVNWVLVQAHWTMLLMFWKSYCKIGQEHLYVLMATQRVFLYSTEKKKIPIPVCLTFSPVFFNIALKSCAKQSQIQEHGSVCRSKQTSVISRCKITEHLRFSILKVQEKHNNRSVKEKDCTELKFVRKLPKPKQRQCSVWHIGTVFH